MEATLIALLNPTFNEHVYWMLLPDGYVFTPGQPVCILQQMGGKAGRYVESDLVPDHKHARVQATIWSDDQLITGPKARAVEDLMVTSALQAEPVGAATNLTDEALKLFGSQQQFAFWYPDP
jgi:hypothetical protein